MTTSRQHQFQIRVRSAYDPSQSEPNEGRFVFAYTINISNQGAIPARLMARHWMITDGNGKMREVRGDGVVGEQPHLGPGQAFEYSSGAIIDTPVGSMQGSYQMLADNGDRFDAPIPPFTLAVPGQIN